MTDAVFNWGQYYPQDEFKFGEYLKRSGNPLFCRLDVRLTNLDELKWAATIISELNKQLNDMAYNHDGDKIMRVLAAREAMQSARFKLRYVKSVTIQKTRPAKSMAKRTTRGGVSQPVRVGNLDRADKSPQPVETKE